MIELHKVLPINLVMKDGKKRPVGGMHASNKVEYKKGMKDFAIQMSDYPHIAVLDLDIKDHPLKKYIDQTYTHETRKGWHCFFKNTFGLTSKRQKQKDNFDLMVGKNWLFYDYDDPDVAFYREYNTLPLVDMPAELYDLVKTTAADVGEDSVGTFIVEPLMHMLKHKSRGLWDNTNRIWKIPNSSELAWAVAKELVPYTDVPAHFKAVFKEVGEPRLDKNGLPIAGVNKEHSERKLPNLIRDAKLDVSKSKKVSWRPQSDFRAVDWAGKTVFADIDEAKLVEYSSYKFTNVDGIFSELIGQFMPTYSKVIFDPEQLDKFQDGKYNLFNGFIAEEQGDGHLMFLDYVNTVLCSSKPDLYSYLVKYMAHMVQKPWEKPDVAIVLFGKDKGTGKDTFHEMLGMVFKQGGYTPLNEEMLIGNFNGATQGTILGVAEELVFGGSHKEDSKLKSLITSKKRVITKKGKESLEVDNYIRLIVTSNSSRPVKATDGERRYFAMKPSAIKKGNYDYWDLLRTDFNPAHLLYHLRNDVDIEHYKTRELPDSIDLKEIIENNKDQITEDVEEWWEEEVYDGDFINTTELFEQICPNDKFMTKRRLTQIVFDKCGKDHFHKTRKNNKNGYEIVGYRERPTQNDGLDTMHEEVEL